MFVPLCVPRARSSLKAAANIEIEGTEISASTLHNTFDLDAEGTSKLDFSKPAMDKVAAVLNMKTLLLDEAPVRLCPCARASVAASELGGGPWEGGLGVRRSA